MVGQSSLTGSPSKLPRSNAGPPKTPPQPTKALFSPPITPTLGLSEEPMPSRTRNPSPWRVEEKGLDKAEDLDKKEGLNREEGLNKAEDLDKGESRGKATTEEKRRAGPSPRGSSKTPKAAR